jgi:hypothetical protein
VSSALLYNGLSFRGGTEQEEMEELARDLSQCPVGSENPTRACFSFMPVVSCKERGEEVILSSDRVEFPGRERL